MKNTLLNLSELIQILKDKSCGIVYNNNDLLIKNINIKKLENNIKRTINKLEYNFLVGIDINNILLSSLSLDIFDYIYINVNSNNCYITKKIKRLGKKSINMDINILNREYHYYIMDLINNV